MMKIKLLNFLYEEENRLIYFNPLTVMYIIIFIFFIALNINQKLKINELEMYIDENHKYTTVANLDYNVDKGLIHISSVEEITQLIDDKNIYYIKIDNNKLNLLGYINNSNNINSYIDRLNKSNEHNNISVESINREGDRYSFEIEANIGYTNEV